MRMRGMPSFYITAQRTPGEGWSKLMEDLTDLRKVLPEASGTAGFFWNGLSFDCFPIVCPQTGRLKKAPNRPPRNKLTFTECKRRGTMPITPNDRLHRRPNAAP